jgi:hypothetical protein
MSTFYLDQTRKSPIPKMEKEEEVPEPGLDRSILKSQNPLMITTPRNGLALAVAGALAIGIPAGYVLAGTASAAPAQDHAAPAHHPASHDHAGMQHNDGKASATQAFREASARMHAGMGDSYTGDVDLDFARGMVPHHRGAVDMARIELQHGTDPSMRELARKVVATQEQEIELMQEWIARHEVKTGSGRTERP